MYSVVACHQISERCKYVCTDGYEQIAAVFFNGFDHRIAFRNGVFAVISAQTVSCFKAVCTYNEISVCGRLFSGYMELLPGMRSNGQILCQENTIVCAIKGLCADADSCPEFIGGFVDDGYNRAAVCLPDNQFFVSKARFKK